PALNESRADAGSTAIGNHTAVTFGGIEFTIGFRTTTEIIVVADITSNPPFLPDGIVGTAYNQQLTGSGGVAPYTFTFVSGNLPPGLVLAQNGVISGTPSASGSYSFVIAVSDDNFCDSLVAYTITVTCPGSPISVGPAAQPNGQAGSEYDVLF